MENIAFIINPVAGNKPKNVQRRKISRYVKQVFPEAVFIETSEKKEATEVAKEKVEEGFRKIVAAGGDGTVNEVATGLIKSGAALGILPTGSGNGLARHLGIPMNLKGAVNFLKKAHPVKIDYGSMNGIPFFNVAGMGFDAMIGDRFSFSQSRGFFSYLKLILSSFISYKPQNYKISINGKKIEKYLFLITFANSSQYGNGAVIAPNAKIDDGLMDTIFLSPFPVIKAIDIGLRLLTKSIGSSNNFEMVKCRKISIERESKGTVHIDGEPLMMGKKVDVQIIPEGLNILV